VPEHWVQPKHRREASLVLVKPEARVILKTCNPGRNLRVTWLQLEPQRTRVLRSLKHKVCLQQDKPEQPACEVLVKLKRQDVLVLPML
jgi:hypothetical protein